MAESGECRRLSILDETARVKRWRARLGDRAVALVEVSSGVRAGDPRFDQIVEAEGSPAGLFVPLDIAEHGAGVAVTLGAAAEVGFAQRLERLDSVEDVVAALDPALAALAWCHARGLSHGGLSHQSFYRCPELSQEGTEVWGLGFADLGPAVGPEEDVGKLAEILLARAEMTDCHPHIRAVLEGAAGPLAERPSSAGVLRALLRISCRFGRAEGAPDASAGPEDLGGPEDSTRQEARPLVASPPPDGGPDEVAEGGGALAEEAPAGPIPEVPVGKGRLRRLLRLGGACAGAGLVALTLWLVTMVPAWWDAAVPTCEGAEDCRLGQCSNGRCAPEGFAYVPGGSLDLGTRQANSGAGLFVQEREVTQRQWKQVTGTEPFHFKECGDDCPVESVSCHEALVYANALSERDGLEQCYTLDRCKGELGKGCQSLDDPDKGGHYCKGSWRCWAVTSRGPACRGYRLPTSVEWDFMVFAPGGLLQSRGGGDPAHWTLGSGEVSFEGAFDCGHFDKALAGERCGPVAVGNTPNQWGIHNLAGNVQEWVDPFDEEAAMENGGLYRLGSRCGLRGGAWAHRIDQVNPNFVGKADVHQRFLDAGIRLVLSASRQALSDLGTAAASDPVSDK